MHVSHVCCGCVHRVLPALTESDQNHMACHKGTKPTPSPAVPELTLTSPVNLPPAPLTPSDPTVPQITRVCTETEFACHSHNECVALEYRCDRRADCRDMSDELNCGEGLPGGTVACGCQTGQDIPGPASQSG